MIHSRERSWPGTFPAWPRRGQPLRQQIVHAPLGRRVERGTRLVEEQPVGPLQEGAGQRQTLLLARREAAIPLMALIELVDIVAKLAVGKRLGDLSIGELDRKSVV